MSSQDNRSNVGNKRSRDFLEDLDITELYDYYANYDLGQGQQSLLDEVANFSSFSFDHFDRNGADDQAGSDKTQHNLSDKSYTNQALQQNELEQTPGIVTPNMSDYAPNDHLLVTQGEREDRLAYLMRVPELVKYLVNSSDFEGLNDLIEHCCVPNMETKLKALPALIGRSKLLDYYRGMMQCSPDYIVTLSKPALDFRVITCVFSSKGTLLAEDPMDFVWNAMKVSTSLLFLSLHYAHYLDRLSCISTARTTPTLTSLRNNNYIIL